MPNDQKCRNDCIVDNEAGSMWNQGTRQVVGPVAKHGLWKAQDQLCLKKDEAPVYEFSQSISPLRSIFW
jgi:hypothetical protein